jgi:hypothetical protein
MIGYLRPLRTRPLYERRLSSQYLASVTRFDHFGFRVLVGNE